MCYEGFFEREGGEESPNRGDEEAEFGALGGEGGVAFDCAALEADGMRGQEGGTVVVDEVLNVFHDLAVPAVRFGGHCRKGCGIGGCRLGVEHEGNGEKALDEFDECITTVGLLLFQLGFSEEE